MRGYACMSENTGYQYESEIDQLLGGKSLITFSEGEEFCTADRKEDDFIILKNTPD
jgi:hypothetical protein